jgi:hypothetical protein
MRGDDRRLRNGRESTHVSPERYSPVIAMWPCLLFGCPPAAELIHHHRRILEAWTRHRGSDLVTPLWMAVDESGSTRVDWIRGRHYMRSGKIFPLPRVRVGQAGGGAAGTSARVLIGRAGTVAFPASRGRRAAFARWVALAARRPHMPAFPGMATTCPFSCRLPRHHQWRRRERRLGEWEVGEHCRVPSCVLARCLGELGRIELSRCVHCA